MRSVGPCSLARFIPSQPIPGSSTSFGLLIPFHSRCPGAMIGMSLGISQPGGFAAGGAAGVTVGVVGQVPAAASQVAVRGRCRALTAPVGSTALLLRATSSRLITLPVRTSRIV